MARVPSRLLESITEDRIATLEEKVAFLWRMVVFLGERPYYKPGDYLAEHAEEVARLTKEPA